MKYITLIIGLLVVGCLTPEQKQQEALRDSVVGEYEFKSDIIDGYTIKYVLLENGVRVWWENGENQGESKWSIVNGEIHLDTRNVGVFKINTDRSITWIADIEDGKRTPIINQFTLKKIK